MLDYLEMRADAQDVDRVRAHLSTGCARCSEQLTYWMRLLDILSPEQASTPPEDVVQRAIAIFDWGGERAHGPRPPSSWLEEVVARLVFDGRKQPAPVGVREAGASFQLLFDAQGTDIDLLCERGERGWSITGQALAPAAPLSGWAVSVTSDAGRAATETDARGEFFLSALAAGVYEVRLRGTSREIVLMNVRLSGPVGR